VEIEHKNTHNGTNHKDNVENIPYHKEAVRTISSAMMSLRALYSRLFQVEVLLIVCQKFVVHSVLFKELHN
jgi:hypothetical protein